jgi:hypothetical protein
MAKAAFNKKKSIHQQIRFRAKEENSEVLHLEHSFMVRKLGLFGH